MRELSVFESEQVSGAGGWIPVVLAAIATYDAVTDFAEGFVEGFEEAGGYNTDESCQG